jgi:hypothetical protein
MAVLHPGHRRLLDLRAAKEEMSSRYLAPSGVATARAATAVISPRPRRNIVGVGIGEKLVDGRATGVLAIKFLVRYKFPTGRIGRQFLLPPRIAGLPTDVEEVGLVRALAAPNPRTKIRPVRPGSSIGYKDPANQILMAGTLGAIVQDASGVYVLSNNHVLADENKLPLGSPIFQPGLLDHGNPATDRIASLTRFIPLMSVNSVDCAIARFVPAVPFSRFILGIGSPTGSEDAAVDMVVHKFGRTTGYTAGRVTSIDTDVNVTYDMGTLTFKSQIVITGLNSQPFSAAGDSGSLILERSTNKAIGLLFAGGPTTTFANHIGDVLQMLGVTLRLGGGGPPPSRKVAPSIWRTSPM